MMQMTGKVKSNTKIKPGYYIMSVDCPRIAREAKPGQFLTVRCGCSTTPLLRRPFGFHRINKGGFEMLYEVKGKGTRLLACLKPGDAIDVLGPLGSGFRLPAKKAFVILAGGIGVAPLVPLAEKLVTIKNAEIYAIIGARSRENLLCADDFARLGIKTMTATDDGSCGKECLATDVLSELLSVKRGFRPAIFACGPKPMLKAAAHIARKRGLECQVSLEENIACGVGACLGCAVNTRHGYKLVCKDGPVFDSGEIIW